MSAFEIVNKPVSEISQFLAQFKAEVKETKFPGVYIIKFNPKTDAENPLVNHLRGLIFDSVKHQVLSVTYPVPVEYKDRDEHSQQEICTKLSQTDYVVHEAMDGTLIRVWWNPCTDCWSFSTNNMEDAHTAYWMNSVSFGELFRNALPPDFEFGKLHKNCVYFFTLCHPLNVIVVNHTLPSLYHVATFDLEQMHEIETDIGIQRPRCFDNMTVEEVRESITECHSKPVYSAGYMLVQKTQPHQLVKRYRFENCNYTKARALRGDSNNIYYTVLGYMLDPDNSKIRDFLTFYPVYIPVHAQLCDYFNATVKSLLHEYVQFYILHKQVPILPRHADILEEIHTKVYLRKLRSIKKSMQIEHIGDHLRSLPTAKTLFLLNIHAQ